MPSTSLVLMYDILNVVEFSDIVILGNVVWNFRHSNAFEYYKFVNKYISGYFISIFEYSDFSYDGYYYPYYHIFSTRSQQLICG